MTTPLLSRAEWWPFPRGGEPGGSRVLPQTAKNESGTGYGPGVIEGRITNWKGLCGFPVLMQWGVYIDEGNSGK